MAKTNALEYFAKRKNRSNSILLTSVKKKLAEKQAALDEEKRKREEEKRLAELRAQQDAENADSPYVKYEQYFKYQNDPVGFAEDILGVTLWSKQKEMLEALTEPPYRVIVAASHSVGKTYVAAIAGLWMAFCFPDSIFLSTAPSQQQVADLLWANIRALNVIDPDIMRGKHRTSYQINNKWFGLGRTPANADAFQGYHGQGGQLIIADEATGIPQFIFEAIAGMDGDDVKILYICNPTDVTSPLYQEYLSGRYKIIHISGLEHPNVKNWFEGKSPEIPGAIQGEHWMSLFRKWSDRIDASLVKEGDIELPEGSGEWYRPGPLAQSRLLGLWPTSDSNNFFSTTHVDRFFQRSGRWDDSDKFIRQHKQDDRQVFDENIQIGVDVARSGGDFSCVSVRYKDTIIQHHRLNGMGTIELANFVSELAEEMGNFYEEDPYDIPLVIDVTGIGAGVVDVLADQLYNVIEVHFSHKPFDTTKYANARTELYGRCAELCKDFHIRLNNDLVEDLGGVIEQQMLGGSIYKYNNKGKFQLIPKDQIRSLIGMSPDDLDSISLAVYYTEGRFTTYVTHSI